MTDPITREQGYAIEGGPEPKPAEDSPERLRERREALGKDDAWIEHILDGLDVGAGPDFGYGRERRIAAEWVSSYTEKSTVTMRAAYAAALSAAEAERAAKPDHLAYADSPVWDDGPLPTPTPERPAPRFKEGDWVRVVTGPLSAGRDRAIQVTHLTSGYIHADGLPWADWQIEPAAPPAPEVVDVPQPAPLPKTVAHFYTIRALPEPHRVSWNMPGDGPQWVRVNDALWLHVDDIRAMLADIDAQRQPDPQPDLDEGWRVVNGDTAFAMPFGTIRECNGCGCLVSGGPTACQRCADAPGPQPGPEAPTRPEPRYKVGDWVRHGGGMPWQVTEVRDYRDCYAYHGALGVFIEGPEVTLSPALDLALHETARTAARMLHKGEWPLKVERARELPGFTAWDTGELRTPDWAAQLERLLGDAP